MAGKSPGKAEQQQSPGVAAEDAVAGVNDERDPRLTYAATALAVAAEGEAEPVSGADSVSGSDPVSDSDPASGSDPAPDSDPASASDSGPDSGEEPRSAAEPGGAPDTRTMSFPAARDDADVSDRAREDAADADDGDAAVGSDGVPGSGEADPDTEEDARGAAEGSNPVTNRAAEDEPSGDEEPSAGAELPGGEEPSAEVERSVADELPEPRGGDADSGAVPDAPPAETSGGSQSGDVSPSGDDSRAEYAAQSEHASPEDGPSAMGRRAPLVVEPPAEEDERLRAAVAAWVQNASSGDAAAEAETGCTEAEDGGEADAAPDAEDTDGDAAGGQGPLPRRSDSPTTALRAPTAPDQPTAPDETTDAPAKPKPAPEKRASLLQQMATAAPKPPTAPDEAIDAPAKPTSAPEKSAGAPAEPGTAPAEPEKPADAPAQRTTAPGEAAAPAKPETAPARPATAPGEAAAPAKPETAPHRPAPKPPAPVMPPRPDAAPRVTAESGSALPGFEQTKQQPLPPYEEKRPLDLLAELTNTPPPPETPLRTVVRRFKIYSPLVVLLAIAFVVVQLLRPLPEPGLTLTARATYGFDGSKPSLPWPDEGQAAVDVVGLGSLGSYGKQKAVPIASVAKVMTAYLMLRDHPVKSGNGDLIPVDAKAADDARTGAEGKESVVDVKAGSKISQREALNAIMIASANNVARLIARWDAGSEEAFVKKMNDAAKELGMDDTHYTDPSGLKHSTVSTAADQVRLGKIVMKDPLFREVVKLPTYKDSQGVDYRNWNGLVPMNHTVGIKTGTTPGAGGNLLFAAEREIAGTKQLIIGAVLGQYKPPIIDTVLAQGASLIDSAQRALTDKKIVKKGDVVGEVDDGLGGTTPVVASRDVTAVGWSGLKVTLDIGPRGDGKVPHEAKAGDVVGELTVGGGQGEVKVPVKLRKDLAEPGAGAKLGRLG